MRPARLVDDLDRRCARHPRRAAIRRGPDTPASRQTRSRSHRTEGFHSALDQARAAAGEREVAIAGGAATVNQYLAEEARHDLDKLAELARQARVALLMLRT